MHGTLRIELVARIDSAETFGRLATSWFEAVRTSLFADLAARPSAGLPLSKQAVIDRGAPWGDPNGVFAVMRTADSQTSQCRGRYRIGGNRRTFKLMDTLHEYLERTHGGVLRLHYRRRYRWRDSLGRSTGAWRVRHDSAMQLGTAWI